MQLASHTSAFFLLADSSCDLSGSLVLSISRDYLVAYYCENEWGRAFRDVEDTTGS